MLPWVRSKGNKGRIGIAEREGRTVRKSKSKKPNIYCGYAQFFLKVRSRGRK